MMTTTMRMRMMTMMMVMVMMMVDDDDDDGEEEEEEDDDDDGDNDGDDEFTPHASRLISVQICLRRKPRRFAEVCLQSSHWLPLHCRFGGELAQTAPADPKVGCVRADRATWLQSLESPQSLVIGLWNFKLIHQECWKFGAHNKMPMYFKTIDRKVWTPHMSSVPQSGKVFDTTIFCGFCPPLQGLALLLHLATFDNYIGRLEIVFQDVSLLSKWGYPGGFFFFYFLPTGNFWSI